MERRPDGAPASGRPWNRCRLGMPARRSETPALHSLLPSSETRSSASGPVLENRSLTVAVLKPSRSVAVAAAARET